MGTSILQVLHMARSGMLARFQDLDVTSNNLANVNSIGFKSSRMNFQELLASARPSGVQVRSTQAMLEQGALRLTGRGLDLAISGEGYLAVRLPSGELGYTRDGALSRDADGQFVTAGGYRLDWSGTLPADATDVRVEADGRVMALVSDVWSQAGTIQLSRFPNAASLTSFGQNLWIPSDISGAAVAGAPGANGMGTIVGGALEQSNVNLAVEMTRLMLLQRGFEMSLKAFQQTDRMMTQAIQLRK
jgi:flagellar basal-body rod protein FlgG